MSELLQPERLAALLGHLGAAILYSAALAFGPGWVLPFGRKLRKDMAQAVIMIGGAAALVVMVIGDSTARAFGLVGLGAFVRFRTPLRDPRDAGAMFVGIGLGMAAGIGAHVIAAVGTVLFILLFGLLGRGDARVLALRADCDDPAAAAPRAREALDKAGCRVLSQDIDGKRGRLRIRVESKEEPDRIREALAAALPEARRLRWELEG